MIKKVISLVVSSIVLYGGEFTDLVNKIDDSAILKSKEYSIKSAKSTYESTKSYNIPKLDIKFDYIHLKDTPQIALHLASGVSWADVGTKDRYEGELSLTYPIFRGFAISNIIKKAQYGYEIEILKKDDLKRTLKYKLANLYGTLYSLNALKIALIEAKKALKSSLEKANGFYEVGLIPKSDLLNIKANYYKTESAIEDVTVNIDIVNNNIYYLTSSYAKADSLPNIDIKNQNIEQREDIKILKKILLVKKSEVNLAKSHLYPELNFIASYKKMGDSISLDGDGYSNENKSYTALELKYNLFNGFSDKNNIQSTKAKYLASKLFLDDYINNVKKDLKNELLKLKSLEKSIIWAKEELQATVEYLKLSTGRFNQQLISSDELNRAIASKAKAKAQLDDIKSKIFIQKAKINILY